MTTPLRAARIANARARVAELLTDRCPHPDSTARDVIDELLLLGWSFPGAHLDDTVPQPSHSTPEGRRRAREIYEKTRREAATTSPTDGSETQ